MVLAMLMFSDMTSRIHSELVMTDDEGSKKYVAIPSMKSRYSMRYQLDGSLLRTCRFVSDKEIQVGEIDKSKRERKKQHLEELKSTAANEDVRAPSCVLTDTFMPRIVVKLIHSLSLWVCVFVLTCSRRLVLSCLAQSCTRTSTPPSTASLVS
jgi:hypothetical protein